MADEHGKDKVFLSSMSTLGGSMALVDEKGTSTDLYPAWAEFSTLVARESVMTPNLGVYAEGDMPSTAAMFANQINRALAGEQATMLAKGADEHLPRGLFAVGENGDAQISLQSKGNPTALAAFAPGGLYIVDDQGFSASVGVQGLVTPRTGETHKTSAASIVLFDKNKNVLWKAPAASFTEFASAPSRKSQRGGRFRSLSDCKVATAITAITVDENSRSWLAMFRKQLPRIYELRDLISDPTSPDAYFQTLIRTFGIRCTSDSSMSDGNRLCKASMMMLGGF